MPPPAPKPPAKPLAITCGDPAGVGPEIIARWVIAKPEQAKRCVLLAPQCILNRIDMPCEPVGPAGFQRIAGQPTEEGARVAWEAMQAAAAGCREGRFGGVVTGPVSKYWLDRVGYPHPGQTEFFAEAWGGTPTMAFVGQKLKLTLATWHIPLRAVPEALTQDPTLMERAIERAYELCRTLGSPEPRIAVCGLNPHAGENGILGTEERDLLDPRLDWMRLRYPGLSRCLPADTVFHRCAQGEFDAAVALYHDQGLAPLKLLEFDTAANVTLGLPWIRTSPDHGTAFEIAGKGQARIDSFAQSVEVALRLSRG